MRRNRFTSVFVAVLSALLLIGSLPLTAFAETGEIDLVTKGTFDIRPVADAYVSSNDPTKVFGSANKLQVSNAYTTLVSFDTENIVNAAKVVLKANGQVEDTVGLEVFALPDYLVDEDALTYNTLISSDAWASKVSLGEYSIVDGNISLDLSAALSNIADLGDTVTLAFVSTDTLVGEAHEPYIFFNDFETPEIGTALTKDSLTIVNTSGTVTRESSTTNAANSVYWYGATGTSKTAKLVNASTVSIPTGAQALGVRTRTGPNIIKFFNSVTSNSTVTTEDVGKVLRLTTDIYTAQELSVTVGMAPAASVSGVNNAFTFYGETRVIQVPAKEWTTLSCLLPVTQTIVDKQAYLVGFMVPYTDDEEPDHWTYFDNLRVEECTPMLSVDSDEEAGTNGFTLTTIVPGVPLNRPFTVSFDEAMDISTFNKGMIVTNETTGERISGKWAATDETNTVFTFTTNGFVANATYSVKTTAGVKTLGGVACEEKVMCRFDTAGSYSIRPIATSYVSKANASSHYGLNTEPILDNDRLGVLTFSTKTLASADAAELYLNLDMPRGTALNIYALDMMPDDSLCYSSVSEYLTDTNLLGVYMVKAGVVGIDLAELIERTYGNYITLVIKAGYTFFNDFETPQIGQTLKKNAIFDNGITKAVSIVSVESQKDLSGNSVSNVTTVKNAAYSASGLVDLSVYWWRGSGATQSAALVTDPTEVNKTQIFRTRLNYGKNGVKFYNAFRPGLTLTSDDVGRSFAISYKIMTPQSITVKTGPVFHTNSLSAMTGTFSTDTTANEWTDISGTITLSAEHVSTNTSSLGILTHHSQGDDTNTTYWQYFDDIKVEEIISEPIKVAKDSVILLTENAGSVDVSDADHPVKDVVYITSEIINAQVSLGTSITVKFYATLSEEDIGAKMKFTMAGKETIVDATEKDGLYIYAFDGISPQRIGDGIDAELIVNGEAVDSYSYSVLEYLNYLKGMSATELQYSDEKYNAMTKLIDDLLIYGGAAQNYKGYRTDALVSKDITGTLYADITSSDFAIQNGNYVTYKGATVYFDSANRLMFKFATADTTGVTLKYTVNGGTAIEITDMTDNGDGTYIIMTDAIYAVGFDDIYTVTAYKNGVADATLTYSVKSYVYSKQGGNDELAALAKATYNYGLAAMAFRDTK